MANIGIYYGSDTGSTESVAKELAKILNIAKEDLHDVDRAKADLSNYDVLLFGTSTTGLGDLLDSWDSFLSKIDDSALSGKKVALFGCGDSVSYSDTFCDGVGKLYEAIKDKGCTIIGKVSPEGYSYDSSEALVDGQFVGLLIDEDNESDKTAERLSLWIGNLKKEI